MSTVDLPNGYYELPKGKMANIATFLEMRAKPARELKALPPGATLHRFKPDEIEPYKALFREVGGDLMWFSRLYWADEQFDAHFTNPAVDSYALMIDQKPAGLLELDFRNTPDCELAFYGLVPSAIGKGLGRILMDEAIRQAWGRPITRLFVHTCNFDGPQAMPMYLRSGFVPFARKVEIHDDPRLTGKLPRGAAPHIPLID